MYTSLVAIKGFSLMELMITVTIIGIITAVAFPYYQNYLIRAHYTEIIQAAVPYRMAVGECYFRTQDFDECDAGTHGIPPNRGQEGGVASVTVVDGVITVTPVEQNGILATDTFILYRHSMNSLWWNESGDGVTKGYTK